jgi:hypothetical protein
MNWQERTFSEGETMAGTASYTQGFDSVKGTIKQIEMGDSQASSNIFAGESTPGPKNKAAGETMTLKRTKMITNTDTLKRKQE